MIEIPVGIAASVSFTCLLRHVVISFFPHHARFILHGGLISSMVTSAAAGLIGIATSKVIAVHSRLLPPPQLLKSSIGDDDRPALPVHEQDGRGRAEVWRKRSMKTEAVASGSNVKARLFPPIPFCSAHCKRTVKCQDAVRWLEEEETIAGAVFTSLPDVTELDMEGEEEEYKKWFLHVAQLILSKLQDKSVAIFYQVEQDSSSILHPPSSSSVLFFSSSSPSSVPPLRHRRLYSVLPISSTSLLLYPLPSVSFTLIPPPPPSFTGSTSLTAALASPGPLCSPWSSCLVVV